MRTIYGQKSLFYRGAVAWNNIDQTLSRGPQLFQITSMALGITVGINESSRDSGIRNHNSYNYSCKFSIFPYIMNHGMCYPLFGKQESQESVKESQNQAKIPKDSRITLIKIKNF